MQEGNSNRFRLRIYAMMAVFLAGCLILVVQLVRWQVVEHDLFMRLAEQEHQQELTIVPRRGDITDRNGFLLAVDTFQYEISASPSMIGDPYATADRLYRLLGIGRHDLQEALTSDAPWVPITRNAPQEVGEAIIEMDITGITAVPRSRRVYPEGALAAHLLGFVNDNGTGFYGVEGYYNPQLEGTAGVRSGERGPFGDIIPLGPSTFVPPKKGASLELTIDRTAQHVVERELAAAVELYGAESGTVIVVDPDSGAIMAMASYPAYSPNDFAATEPTLYADPSVSEQYEPGSVFKVITLSAGIDSGIVTPQSLIYDAGYIEVGGRTIYNSDRQAHGQVDITEVMARSLNVGAAQVAVTMGRERFYTYVRRFGFGRITEIDLASEGPGVLKVPGDPNWHESDLGTNSFGQGIAVTPLQMVMAVSAIANDGLLMKPYVVQEVVEEETNRARQVQPTVVRRAVSAETARTMTEMLVTVVEQSVPQARVEGYRVAGKTGTAEIPVPGGYHPYLTVASFAGYIPADDPAFVILVIINKPTVSRWGSQVAAPVFSSIARQLVVIEDVPPDNVRLARRDL